MKQMWFTVKALMRCSGTTGTTRGRAIRVLLPLALMLSACFQIAPVAPAEADLSALATPAYLADFQNSSTTSVLSSIKVGSGVVFKGTGTANTKTITVIGKKRWNGAFQTTQLAKVVNLYGSKRLGVVSTTTSSTLGSQGGLLGFVFAPGFSTTGVNVASIKVSNITTSGGTIKLYPVSGATKTLTLAQTGAGVTKTITLNASGIKAMDIIGLNPFTVDDLVFDVTSSSALPPDPGTAGKATVAGIDSNNNGLRDDVERYVALTYANDKPTLDIFNAYAKLLQNAVTKTQTTTTLTSLQQQTIQLTYCLRRWRPASAELDEQKFLFAFYNTDARFYAEKNYVSSIPSSTYKLDESLLANCSAEIRAKSGSTVSSFDFQAAATGKEIIFFINGVGNNLSDAYKSVDALRTKIGKPVQLLYNPSSGYKIYDLIEATAQKYDEPKYTWRDWAYSLTTKVYAAPIAYMTGLLSKAATASVTAAELTKFRAAFKNFNEQNYKITIVSHSQGNLFANTLFDQIKNDSTVPNKNGEPCGLDVVAVATPANRTVGSKFYYTVNNDKVIMPIPTALPGKPANPGAWTLKSIFGLNHSFLEYLNGPTTGPKIRDAINSSFSKMAYPDACKGTHIGYFEYKNDGTWPHYETQSSLTVELDLNGDGLPKIVAILDGEHHFFNQDPHSEYDSYTPKEVYSIYLDPQTWYYHMRIIYSGTYISEFGTVREDYLDDTTFLWDGRMSGELDANIDPVPSGAIFRWNIVPKSP